MQSQKIEMLHWSKEELQKIDIKNRKLLTFAQCFHLNNNIERL